MTLIESLILDCADEAFELKECKHCKGTGRTLTRSVDKPRFIKIKRQQDDSFARILRAYGLYCIEVYPVGPAQPDVSWYEIGNSFLEQ